jgi:lysozyme
MREINEEGLNLIKSFESLRLNVYDDGVGVKTIGYGHAIRPGEKFTKITPAQAEALLRSDLHVAESAVGNGVKVPLSDNQYAALVSLVFNIGAGAFSGSTLLRRLNQRDYAGAANEFLKWNKGGGRVMAGLTRRRTAERELFLKA